MNETYSDIERFWSLVDKNGPLPANKPELGHCWLWLGAPKSRSGIFCINGKQVQAHRWIFGPVKEGNHVHHKCHTPRCVNPSHLEELTPAQHIAAHPEVDKPAFGKLGGIVGGLSKSKAKQLASRANGRRPGCGRPSAQAMRELREMFPDATHKQLLAARRHAFNAVSATVNNQISTP